MKKKTIMYSVESRPDMVGMLSALSGIIREQGTPKIGALMTDEMGQKLGIRRLTFDRSYSNQPFPGLNNGDSIISGRWNKIKNDRLIQELSRLFSSCPIIEFADWAAVSDASGFWDGLYSDVIKPLKRRDFQFLFHLGD